MARRSCRGPGAVVADDHQPCFRQRRVPRRRSRSVRHAPAIEERTDEQHERLAPPELDASRRARGDAGRNHADASPFDLEYRSISARENSRVGEDDRGRCAARRVSQRRRSPSRARNHSGCAMNETSWMVTPSGTPHPQRRRVGGREEHVQRIARARAAAGASAPTRCPGRGRRSRDARWPRRQAIASGSGV